MRGKFLHNYLVNEVVNSLHSDGWQVYTEYRVQRRGIVSYVDIWATKAHYQLICEVETTPRHALDNLRKNHSLGLHPWLIVPTRKVQTQIQRQISQNSDFAIEPATPVYLIGQFNSTLRAWVDNYSRKEL